MAYTNLFFIFGFLPLSWIGYRFCPGAKAKNIFLLLVSWLFYAWSRWDALLVLLIVTIWCFACGRQIESMAQNEDPKQKIMIAVSVSFLVLILFVYKYVNGWLHVSLPLAMPLGLSFYIFSALSYIGDVAMKKVPCQNSFLDLGLYIGFFPKLIMGPISEYRDFKGQLQERTITAADLSSGTLLFMKGLVKKVVLADSLAVFVSMLQDQTTFVGTWVLALSYTFQLYFDFSGYSDMAIGIGRWFGFDIPKNFDHPYIADSVQNFWRRWHISLSTWFRDYVYIPLGGSRVDVPLIVRNIVIVWVLTGIWHGANAPYIVWGVYYALLLLGERFFFKPVLARIPRPVRIVLIFLIANAGWVFFAAPSISQAFVRLGCMSGIASGFADAQALFALGQAKWLLLFSMIASTPAIDTVQNWIFARFGRNGMVGLAGVYCVLFAACISLLVASTSQTFLYAAF